MTQRFVVVAYDIPNNRRRTRLHNRLKDYGTPVQYSVFECLLDDRQLARMQAAVARIIKPRLDHVRYYFLCAACQGKIETTRAGKEPVQEETSWVV
ncbi:MAG: CRISPR-associated endonuclease Cas2 [Caldilineaceae bacterium]|nr:CRISPR-associated endonuclease Cas2 [Caldilineaceae bacterium]